MITGVEIETEGGRWVYDLPASTLERLEGEVRGAGPGKKKAVVLPKSGWEEGDWSGSLERGEWRRRRWVRVVERKAASKGS